MGKLKIASWIKRNIGSIKDDWKRLKPSIKNAVSIGVIVTENIKNFVMSPYADVLTAIIPGNIDDKIKDKLRKELPVIVTNLKLAESCQHLTDPNEIVACAIKTLQSLHGSYQKAFLNELAVIIGEVAADGELTWDDLQYIVKIAYDQKLNNGNNQ